MVSARLPEALAGKDNEVEANEDGLRKVVELVTGVGLAAGIATAGLMAWNYIETNILDAGDQSMGDLY